MNQMKYLSDNATGWHSQAILPRLFFIVVRILRKVKRLASRWRRGSWTKDDDVTFDQQRRWQVYQLPVSISPLREKEICAECVDFDQRA